MAQPTPRGRFIADPAGDVLSAIARRQDAARPPSLVVGAAYEVVHQSRGAFHATVLGETPSHVTVEVLPGWVVKGRPSYGAGEQFEVLKAVARFVELARPAADRACSFYPSCRDCDC